MLPSLLRDQILRSFLEVNKIASLDELKTAVGSTSTMTIYRSLSRLGYLSSYSHRGRFYTLASVPVFDARGLWSFRSVLFSRHGNLIQTAAFLVSHSEHGFTASELEGVLQIEARHALLQLLQRQAISRAELGGHLVYLSADLGERRRQMVMRQAFSVGKEVGAGVQPEQLPDELKAGIILFFSLLDEKQRRLYAGLEAAKLGYGGDRQIASLLGLDPHTVSKGRLELFSDTLERKSVRVSGGGRKPLEKKHPK